MIGQSRTLRLLLGTLALSVLALASQTACTRDTGWEKANDAGVKAFQEGRYPEAEPHLTAALKEAEKFGKPKTRAWPPASTT